MGTRRVVALGFALPVLAFAAVAPAQAAVSHPSVRSAPAVTAKPAQTEGVLSNGYGDAKYNSTAGTWRLASGSATDLLIYPDPDNTSVYIMQDETTGDYVDWVSSTGITETTNYSLSRAHWARDYCSPGASYENVYAEGQIAYPWLYGDTVGSGLELDGLGCEYGSDVWTFSGTLGS